MDLVVAFWNRRQHADAQRQAAWLTEPRRCGCPPWDILILAEVPRRAIERFRSLGDESRSWSELAGVSSGGRAHGLMVVSRGSNLGELRRPYPPETSPAPLPNELIDHVESRGDGFASPRAFLEERWVAVDVLDRVGKSVLTVSGFHAPYAAGERVWDTLQNRLTKRKAYQELERWVLEEANRPLLVGMDGNNWSDWVDAPRAKATKPKRYRNQFKRMMDEADLFDAESRFHGGTPEHGLLDTFRAALANGDVLDPHDSMAAGALHPSAPLAVTYRLKHDAHRMDRIYASSDVRVLQAGVCHGDLTGDQLRVAVKGDRLAPDSDHAMVWARIEAG